MKVKTDLRSRYFLALDMDDRAAALRLARQTKNFVGGFKIGPRLTYKYGAKIVSELSRWAPVFVDNKFHDIPSTVISGVRATFESGATFVTVHASNGHVCLRQLAELETELNAKRYFKILAVTVLTSLNQETLPKNWQQASIASQVAMLAEEVIQSGLTGLVCSPQEVKAIRARYPQAFLVTPGVRFANDAAGIGDQARVMDPNKAIEAGASALVIGRSILAGKNPAKKAREIAALLARP